MIQGKFQGRKTLKDIVTSMIVSVRTAKELGARTVGVNSEDASRTDINRLIDCALASQEAGADRFRYCDTLGADDPITIYERIKELSLATNIALELHCHNDPGMAKAVSCAGAQGAIESGVDAYINTTVNGYGERCGNSDLVSTILALKYSHGLSRKVLLDEQVNLREAWKIAKYAACAFGLSIQSPSRASGPMPLRTSPASMLMGH